MKVSVIIPTHNRPELLKRALESVYTQTFQDFEVIVVDDGDSPRAESVLENFVNRPNFFYVETGKNEGAPVARNMGITAAAGEYIAFLDDDDQWVQDKLEIQISAYTQFQNKNKLGFIFSSVENIYYDKTVVTQVDESIQDYSVISLKKFNGFLTSTLLIPKKVFAEVGGFDPQLPSHQEPDLIIRISQKYSGIGINKPLVKMNMSDSDDHIGGNLMRRIQGREVLLEKHRDLYMRQPNQLAHSYQWLAYRYRDFGNTAEAKRYMHLALKIKFSFTRLLNLILFTLMNFKHWVVKNVFAPEHYGNLQRGYYVNKYLPDLNIQNPQILDAGCGHGLHTTKLLKRYPDASIEAIDIKPSDNWKSFDGKKVEFKVLDLKDYNEVEKNDLAVTVDVLEHIIDNKIALEKLCKSIKPGGYLYMAVPCDRTAPFILPAKWFSSFKEWEIDEHIGEQWLLQEWKDMLKEFGMTVKTARYTFTLWGRFAWEIQFLLRGNTWGDRVNLLLMPFYRVFSLLDVYLPIGKGNNLIVAFKNNSQKF